NQLFINNNQPFISSNRTFVNHHPPITKHQPIISNQTKENKPPVMSTSIYQANLGYQHPINSNYQDQQPIDPYRYQPPNFWNHQHQPNVSSFRPIISKPQ